MSFRLFSFSFSLKIPPSSQATNQFTEFGKSYIIVDVTNYKDVLMNYIVIAIFM